MPETSSFTTSRIESRLSSHRNASFSTTTVTQIEQQHQQQDDLYFTMLSAALSPANSNTSWGPDFDTDMTTVSERAAGTTRTRSASWLMPTAYQASLDPNEGSSANRPPRARSAPVSYRHTLMPRIVL